MKLVHRFLVANLALLGMGACATKAKAQVILRPKPTPEIQTMLDAAAAASSNVDDRFAGLQKALDRAIQLKDNAGQADALDLFGKLNLLVRKYKEAQTWFEKEVAFRESVGDRGGLASAISNVGLALYDLGEFQHALVNFEKALPITKETKYKVDEATILSNIGLAYGALGKDKVAIEFYEKSIPLERELGLKQTEQATLPRCV